MKILMDNDDNMLMCYDGLQKAIGLLKGRLVRCDMTEEFPLLVTKMSPYYDR